MVRFRSISILLVFFMTLAASGLDAEVLTREAKSQSPTESAVCSEFADYLKQIRRTLAQYSEDFLFQFSTLTGTDAEVAFSSALEVLPLLNPQELKNLTELLDGVVAALELIIPPQVARELHSDLITWFRLSANLSRDAARSGLPTAFEFYSSFLESAAIDIGASFEIASSTCPSLLETDSSTQVPTPQSVPGQADLKNVHDAIAAQGANVEYGRQTVRSAGLTPVGQQLIVEGAPVYVFIFASPEEREEQVGVIDLDAVEISTASGADAATGDLVAYQGSNILTISDGAPQDVQAMIDAGVQSLP